MIKNHVNGEESQVEDSARKDRSTVETGLKEHSLKMRNRNDGYWMTEGLRTMCHLTGGNELIPFLFARVSLLLVLRLELSTCSAILELAM